MPRMPGKPLLGPKPGSGAGLARPGFGPEPDQQLGKIRHARADGAGRRVGPGKRRHHGASFLVVMPQLGVDPGDRPRRIGRIRYYGTNLVVPVLSLFGMTLYIVVKRLLEPVEAHCANLPPILSKTTVKTMLTGALHLHAIRG